MSFDYNSDEDIFVCTVEELDESLKSLIKKRLVEICEGQEKAQEDSHIYDYQNTLIEFFIRYDSKDPEKQKGMIGELLAHLIIVEYFVDFKPSSPFFNLEEKSFTKGFDIVLLDSSDNSLWLTEVKSGVPNNNQSTDDKNLANLQAGKSDIKNKLDNDQTIFWRNALNKITINDKKSKEIVKDILDSRYLEAREGESESEENNVIISSVVYNDLSDGMTVNHSQNYMNHISSDFKEVMFFSIHQETLEEIADFLRSEIEDV